MLNTSMLDSSGNLSRGEWKSCWRRVTEADDNPLAIRRSRPLFPRAIIVNTCEETPGLYVAGKEFSILLAPPAGGPQELEDGRALHAIGTYVRYLDTDQNYLMLWKASVVEDVVMEGS